MVLKKISDLTSASAITNTDLLEIAEADSGSASGYVSKKVTGQKLKEFASEDSVQWSDNMASGVKNYFLYPFFGHPKQGEVYTKRGIDFTDNGDGGIKANGVNDNTGNSYCQIHTMGSDATRWFYLPKGKYFFSGGISDDYYMSLSWSTKSDLNTKTNLGQDYGNGFEFEITDYMAENYVFHSFAYVLKGKTADNIVFYPMIRRLDDTDSTFSEYAPTNKALYERKIDNRLLADVETTGNASRAYTAGEYMIWRDELYKVTSNISSGGAITENSNVSKTTIGAELKSLFDAIT